MTRRIRRLRGLGRPALVAALAASLGLVALPGTASAHRGHGDSDYEDSDRRHDRRVYRSGHRHHRHDRRHHRRHTRRSYRVHVHGDHCSSRHAPIRRQVRRSSYTCDPCGHRFHSRSRFHRHLTRHHRIPFWQLPHVIFRSTLGWVFHG